MPQYSLSDIQGSDFYSGAFWETRWKYTDASPNTPGKLTQNQLDILGKYTVNLPIDLVTMSQGLDNVQRGFYNSYEAPSDITVEFLELSDMSIFKILWLWRSQFFVGGDIVNSVKRDGTQNELDIEINIYRPSRTRASNNFIFTPLFVKEQISSHLPPHIVSGLKAFERSVNASNIPQTARTGLRTLAGSQATTAGFIAPATSILLNAQAVTTYLHVPSNIRLVSQLLNSGVIGGIEGGVGGLSDIARGVLSFARQLGETPADSSNPTDKDYTHVLTINLQRARPLQISLPPFVYGATENGRTGVVTSYDYVEIIDPTGGTTTTATTLSLPGRAGIGEFSGNPSNSALELLFQL